MTNSFPDDNSIALISVRETIDLVIKSSTAKVTGQGSLHLPKYLFPDDYSCFSLDYTIIFKLHIMCHSSLGDFDFGVKGQGNGTGLIYCFSIINYSNLTPCQFLSQNVNG